MTSVKVKKQRDKLGSDHSYTHGRYCRQCVLVARFTNQCILRLA